jgi:glycosyltransferase involved in cell wall biosynthesis
MYSTLEGRRITGAALQLAKGLDVPLVPHFMDDWLVCRALSERGLMSRWTQADLRRKVSVLMREAPVRLVIGEDMAVAYEQRYGGRFYPFSNCVDLARRPAVKSRDRRGQPFQFGLTGRLLYGRANGLGDIIDALRALGAKGVAAEVVIYQHDPDDVLPPGIREAPQVRLASEREEELLETPYCAVDAFIHIDPFVASPQTYLRYSISGKLPWYLAAGVPVLAYGAPTTGTMRFLSEQRCAEIIDRRDPKLLLEALGRVIRDRALGRQLGARARAVAEKFFDASVQHEAFRRVLAQACRGNGLQRCPSSTRIEAS